MRDNKNMTDSAKHGDTLGAQGGAALREDSALPDARPEPPPGDATEHPPTHPQQISEPRWSLGFVGVLGYVIVEYMRLPMSYEFFRTIYIAKVVVGVAFLGWLLAPRLRGGDRSLVRAMDIAMAALLVGAFCSMLFAEYIGLAWDSYVELLKWALIYLLIARTVTSTWRAKILVFLLLLLNLKLAQAGIRYFYNARAYWGNEMIAVREGARAGSTGFFSNSADYGVAMCVVWPLATMLLFSKPKRLWRILLPVCVGVMLVAIMVCGSRGAVVGAACVLLVAWLRSPRKSAAFLMLILFLPGIFFVIPNASKERFRSVLDYKSDATATSRIIFWKAGLKMFRDHPLLGVGLANFPKMRVAEYMDYEGPARAYVPHSIYIQALSELGIAGVVPFLALWILSFKMNSKTRKRLLAEDPNNRRSFEYCFAAGLDLAMVGYLASGAFVAVLYYPHLWVLLGLTSGLHAGCSLRGPRAEIAPSAAADPTLQPAPA